MMPAQAAAPRFGVYVHWPFCKAKCPYCDFNSHVRDAVDQDRWRRALLAELAHFAEQTEGRTVDTVFFGGGTPSLMPPETAAAVIEAVRGHWRAAADLEVTLEANPTSVEAGRFAALAEAGVNRLSLGVQALDAGALRFLGRQHDVGEALDAIGLAARHFPRHSFDLIYARPGQSRAAWRRELRAALAHAGEHVSVYQLTIEPGTAFATRFARGDLLIPEENLAGAMYEDTQEILAGAGLPAYEISNHARPGAECRHNLVYWTGGDWVGVGPGAHGRITGEGARWALAQARAPETWLGAVEKRGHATRERHPLPAEAVAEEQLMMGLRLARGVDLERLRGATGASVEDWAAPERLAELCEAGFLERADGCLRATAAGRQRLDAVLARLLA